MWDNAAQLRTLANTLLGISMLLILFAGVRFTLHLPVFAIKTVQIKNISEHVSIEQMKRVIHEQIRGNFFTVDLRHARQAFEQLPWVRKVSVRRKFPWGLEVEVEEQVALARRSETTLVNTYGEIFSARSQQILPVFIGQADASIQMKTMYGELAAKLQPLQQQIVKLSLSPRFAWQLSLDNGMVLELGREQMQQRMARFVDVYPYSLATLKHTVTHVDLRYSNGFAAYLPHGAGVQRKRTSRNRV